MKISRSVLFAATLSTLVAAAAPLGAHGIWLAQRARHLALIYGEGADDLDAVRRLPLVKAVTAYGPDWQPVEARARVDGIIPVIDHDKSAAAVAAVMDYGLWSKTPDGKWHNKGRDEVPTATLSEHNWKYAVHLTGIPRTPVPLFAGHTLQLVPVGTAIPQKLGQRLKVRAYFEGKPVAGASILSDYVNDPDQAPTRTAADGTATIAVRNQGLNVLMAVYVGPSDDKAKADHREHRASLSFVLPHLPE